MIVADSSVWIDFFREADAPYVDALRFYWDADELVVTDAVIMEVLQGFRNDTDYAAAQKTMNRVIYRSFWGKCNMERAASNYRLLRKNGVTIRKPNDVVIGTFCIENRYQLLHNDHDFEPMEQLLGLQVVR